MISPKNIFTHIENHAITILYLAIVMFVPNHCEMCLSLCRRCHHFIRFCDSSCRTGLPDFLSRTGCICLLRMPRTLRQGRRKPRPIGALWRRRGLTDTCSEHLQSRCLSCRKRWSRMRRDCSLVLPRVHQTVRLMEHTLETTPSTALPGLFA